MAAAPSTPRLGEAGAAPPGAAEQMFAALVGDRAYPISSEFWRQLLELPLTLQWPRERVLQACHSFANFVLLPYYTFNYLVSASAEGATSQLADNSLLVLLILIHYRKCISMNESIPTNNIYVSDSSTNVKDAPALI